MDNEEMGLASSSSKQLKAKRIKGWVASSTPSHPSKRSKRSHQSDDKGNIPLHQEFIKIIEAAKSAAKTGHVETEQRSCEKEKNNEQLVPSPVSAPSRKSTSVLSTRDFQNESSESIVPSPHSMVLMQQECTSSSEFTNSVPYMNQAPRTQFVSHLLNENLPITGMNIDGLMHEMLQKSPCLLNVSLDVNSCSSHHGSEDSDNFVDVCETGEELLQFSQISYCAMKKSANSNLSVSPCMKDKNSQSTSFTYQETPQVIRDLEKELNLKETNDVIQKDPETNMKLTEIYEPLAQSSGIYKANKKVENTQFFSKSPESAFEEAMQDPDNLPTISLSKTVQSDEVHLHIPNKQTAEIKLNSEVHSDSQEREPSNSEDMFGDLSLSYSQFQHIDAQCHEMKEDLPQPMQTAPQETHPPEEVVSATVALDMTWVGKVSQGRQRLQSITQELSRLNAMVLRARRTLWPQHQQVTIPVSSPQAPQEAHLNSGHFPYWNH